MINQPVCEENAVYSVSVNTQFKVLILVSV